MIVINKEKVTDTRTGNTANFPNVGDLLIEVRTMSRHEILESDKTFGFIVLTHGKRRVKRSIGQYIRNKAKFIHVRHGSRLETELAFFCPVKNKMVVLGKDTVFLGEV
jgi:hypothetical protein